MRHYPRNIGDWMAATAHLLPIEECMYSRLIDQYYARELPLPLDLAACCRLARAMSPTERKAVSTVINEYFERKDDGWHQKRCDLEIAAYQERSASASLSAQQRWLKRSANAMRTHMPTHSEGNATRGNANQEPVTNNQEPTVKDKPARKRATPLPPDFGISDSVREWAADKGYDRLPERLEHFVGYARANGKRYEDWEQAFMNAIRDDWAKLERRSSTGNSKADKRARVAAEMYAGRTDERTIDGTAERLD